MKVKLYFQSFDKPRTTPRALGFHGFCSSASLDLEELRSTRKPLRVTFTLFAKYLEAHKLIFPETPVRRCLTVVWHNENISPGRLTWLLGMRRGSRVLGERAGGRHEETAGKLPRQVRKGEFLAAWWGLEEESTRE